MGSQPLRDHQQEHIFNEFNGTCYVPNSMDVQTGAIWDSVELQPGQEFNREHTHLFTFPISYPAYPLARTKTQVDTNMQMSRRLPAPEAFSIARVVFTFSRDTADEDLYTIAEQSLFRLWIGQKYYIWSVLISMPAMHQPIAPFRICSFCAGVFVNQTQCPGCGAKDFQLANLGDPQLTGRQFAMDVYPRLVIGNQTTFYMTFDCQPYRVKNRFKMWCHLEGLHARGVQ